MTWQGCSCSFYIFPFWWMPLACSRRHALFLYFLGVSSKPCCSAPVAKNLHCQSKQVCLLCTLHFRVAGNMRSTGVGVAQPSGWVTWPFGPLQFTRGRNDQSSPQALQCQRSPVCYCCLFGKHTNTPALTHISHLSLPYQFFCSTWRWHQIWDMYPVLAVASSWIYLRSPETPVLLGVLPCLKNWKHTHGDRAQSRWRSFLSSADSWETDHLAANVAPKDCHSP